jgi:hypothetical protein
MVAIPSSFKADIFPVVSDRPAEDIAHLIAERYHQLRPPAAVAPTTNEGPTPAPVPPPAPPTSPALALWREKLGFLQAEEATVVDPDQKFRLSKLIEEAKAKIREHGGER